MAGVSEDSLSWTLVCEEGYAPDPVSGSIATCTTSGISVPQPCQVDAGCNGDSAVPSGTSTTDCPATMFNGDTCKAVCSMGTSARDVYGNFLCSLGELVGESTCIDPDSGATTREVERVSGSLRIETSSTPSEDDIKTALVDALPGVELRHVVSASVIAVVRRLTESGTFPLRRLGDVHQVDYTIDVPIGMQTVSLVNALQSLSADSDVAQAFKESLKNNADITVASISHRIAPRSYIAVVVDDPLTVTNTVTVTVTVTQEGQTVTQEGQTVTVTVPVPSPGRGSTEKEDNTNTIMFAVVGTFFGTICLVGIVSVLWYHGPLGPGARERSEDDMEGPREAGDVDGDHPEIKIELPDE